MPRNISAVIGRKYVMFGVYLGVFKGGAHNAKDRLPKFGLVQKLVFLAQQLMANNSGGSHLNSSLKLGRSIRFRRLNKEMQKNT